MWDIRGIMIAGSISCFYGLSIIPMYAGQLFVAKGDLQQASGFFKIVLDEDPNNIPALLGRVCPLYLVSDI